MINPITLHQGPLAALRHVDLTTPMRHLASGRQVERAADNPAALAMVQILEGQARGVEQAGMNLQTGVSAIQTAEGALSETSDLLQRGRELAVQAANGTLTAEDRQAIQGEIGQIQQGLNAIGQQTTFNTQQLLAGGQLQLQAGPNAGETTQVALPTVNAGALGVGATDVTTQAGAQAAIGQFDTAIQQTSTARADLGATQNRIESTINNLSNQFVTTRASQSQLQDANVAAEQVNLTRALLLQQAGVASLAHGGLSRSLVARLLG